MNLIPALTSGAAILISALAVEGLMIGGLQNGLYSLASHMYPAYAKATGIGAASSVGRLGAVASAFTGVVALERGGSPGFFGVIAAAMLAMVAAISLLGADRKPA